MGPGAPQNCSPAPAPSLLGALQGEERAFAMPVHTEMLLSWCEEVESQVEGDPGTTVRGCVTTRAAGRSCAVFVNKSQAVTGPLSRSE